MFVAGFAALSDTKKVENKIIPEHKKFQYNFEDEK
jgi:hypothetical protein